MSQLAVGHPDFQEYATWRGPALFSGALTITSVTPKTISGYVTAYASAYVTVAQTAGTGVTVKISFYTDSTLATQVGPSDVYVVNNSVALNVLVPCLGNFMVVNISTAQAGNQTMSVGVTLSNVQVPAKRWPAAGNRVASLGVILGVGGQLTAQLPQVMEGDGYFSISKSNAAADSNAYVQEENEAQAAISRLVTMSPLQSAISTPFQCGPNPVQVVINNGAAGNQTFIYWCSVVGR